MRVSGENVIGDVANATLVYTRDDYCVDQLLYLRHMKVVIGLELEIGDEVCVPE